jgi:hypothetical protein
MNRTLTTFILAIFILSCSDNKVEKKSCFSKINYEIIHSYVQNKIEIEQLSSFTSNDYNLSLTDRNEIIINKKKELIGKIKKDEGIFSVAMNRSNNEKLVAEMNLLFCNLISKIRLEKKELKPKTDFQKNKIEISIIDSLKENNQLLKKRYPSMSSCGGGIYGLYFKNELKLIESKYGAELGFSSRKVYWKENKILKIVYREYFAKWEKYAKNYPPKKVKYSPEKMTYTDTIYKITFGEKYEFKKIANEKVISERIDLSLIDNLKECSYKMKNELERTE